MQNYELGEWTVEPSLNRLTRHGREVRLTTKLMDLLNRLASSAGQLVTRETLLADVWGGRLVNDEVLSRAIAQLRSALDDSAKDSVYIETIPRRGYRLLETPQPIGEQPTRRRARSSQGLLIALAATGLFAAVAWLFLGSQGRPDLSNETPSPEFSQAQQITAWPGHEKIGQVLPRAEEILTVARQDKQFQIRRLNLKDGSYEVLLSATSLLAAPVLWGQTLIFVEVGATCSVQRFDLNTQSKDRLASCLTAAPIGLSLVGNRLSYTDDQGRLAAVDLEQGETKVLTKPGAAQVDMLPAWSPDGSQIAFSRGDEITAELHLLNVNSGAFRQLTSDRQLVLGSTWIGDAALVFSSDRDGVRELWKMHLADESLAPVGVSNGYGPQYDESSNRLFYEQARFFADIWRIENGQEQQIVQSTRYDNHPTISPDGTQMAFVSLRTGRPGLWLANSDGSNVRLLYSSENGRLTRPTWHPGGKHVMATLVDNAGSQLIEVPVDGAALRIIEFAGQDVAMGVYLPDGRIATVGQTRFGSAILIQTGREFRATQGTHTRHIQVCGDGQLFFSRVDKAGLFRLDIATQIVETVVADHPSQWWNHWACDDNRLYFRVRDGTASTDHAGADMRLESALFASGIGLTMDAHDGTIYVTQDRQGEVDIFAKRIAQ